MRTGTDADRAPGRAGRHQHGRRARRRRPRGPCRDARRGPGPPAGSRRARVVRGVLGPDQAAGQPSSFAGRCPPLAGSQLPGIRVSWRGRDGRPRCGTSQAGDLRRGRVRRPRRRGRKAARTPARVRGRAGATRLRSARRGCRSRPVGEAGSIRGSRRSASCRELQGPPSVRAWLASAPAGERSAAWPSLDPAASGGTI